MPCIQPEHICDCERCDLSRRARVAAKAAELLGEALYDEPHGYCRDVERLAHLTRGPRVEQKTMRPPRVSAVS